MTILDLEVTVNQGTVVYVFMAKWIVSLGIYCNFCFMWWIWIVFIPSL